MLVLGPSIGRGFLLLLDFPSGPHANIPSLFPLPSEGLVSSSRIGFVLTRALEAVAPAAATKILIAAIIFVAGTGAYRLLSIELRVSVLPAVAGATFFAINPFFYDRLLAGQLLLVLGFASLPWVGISLVRLNERPRIDRLLRTTGSLVLTALVDLHAGAVALLLFCGVVLVLRTTWLRRAGFIALGVLALIVANLYWIVPAIVAHEAARLGTADVRVFAPRPHSVSILPRELVLHGFFRDEFNTPLRDNAALFLGTMGVLLLLAVVGVVASLRTTSRRGLAGALCITTLIALVLGMGTSFPLTAPLSRFLFTHVPGYGIFRDPQKWIALLALAEAVFIAIGIHVVLRLPRWPKVVLSLSAVALPLVATHVMLWSFGGQIRASTFPNGWQRAEVATRDQDGKLLFLPFDLYPTLPFAQNRAIASPADDFFTIDTLVSQDPVLGRSGTTGQPDPRANYVAKVLDLAGGGDHFGDLVSPANVHYVALARVGFSHQYDWLFDQADLKVVFRDPDLVLFENSAWQGQAYPLAPTGGTDRPAQIRFADGQERVPLALNRWPADPGTTLGGPGFTRRLPVWGRVGPKNAPFVGTDLSCRDGWRLGNDVATCNLGALAAYPGSKEPRTLWRPGYGTQLIWLIVSLVSVLALVVVAEILAGRARRREPSPSATVTPSE